MTKEVSYMDEVRRFGIFVWEPENKYRRVNAIGMLYMKKKAAENAAKKLNEGTHVFRGGKLRKSNDVEVVPTYGYVVRTVWLGTRVMWVPVDMKNVLKGIWCDCDEPNCHSVIMVNKEGNVLCLEDDIDYTNIPLPDNVRLCERHRLVIEGYDDKWSPYGLTKVWENCPLDVLDGGRFIKLTNDNGVLFTIELPDNIRLCRIRK